MPERTTESGLERDSGTASDIQTGSSGGDPNSEEIRSSRDFGDGYLRAVNETSELQKPRRVSLKENPLWLPVGSVRALIAFGVVSTFLLVIYNGKQVPETLYGIMNLVLGFYFGSRKK